MAFAVSAKEIWDIYMSNGISFFKFSPIESFENEKIANQDSTKFSKLVGQKVKTDLTIHRIED